MTRLNPFRNLIRRFALRVAVLLLFAAAACLAEDAPTTETAMDQAAGTDVVAPSEPAVEAVEAQVAPTGDVDAAMFVNRCAGCHTVGGAGRSGPDLLPASTWNTVDLRASVKRMEKSAGPMSDAEIDGLVSFLKDSTAKDRIGAEESRRRVMHAATIEPGSVSKGHDLYFGASSLTNGGSNCAACHATGGRGGNLGPDLTLVFDRFGEAALVSSIEGSNFLVMKPIYEQKPITLQEAAHLTAFLQDEAESARRGDGKRFSPPVGAIGTVLAAGMIGVLLAAGIRRRPGTRARLIAEANRR